MTRDNRTERQAMRDSLDSRLWAFQTIINDELNQVKATMSADAIRVHAKHFRVAANAAEQVLSELVTHVEGVLP